MALLVLKGGSSRVLSLYQGGLGSIFRGRGRADTPRERDRDGVSEFDLGSDEELGKQMDPPCHWRGFRVLSSTLVLACSVRPKPVKAKA